MYDKQEEKVKALGDALKNAQGAHDTYTQRVETARQKIDEAERSMEELKNSTGDTTEEQKKLTTELADLQRELQEATRGQEAAERSTNDWQRQVNNAQVELNNLNRELTQNNTYLDEAKRSADGCATSIDKMGKETRETADATSEAAEQGGLLGQIFAGGFAANIASRALETVTQWLRQFIAAAFEAADSLMKMSDQTGRTVEDLQVLQYIGEDVGVSVDTIVSAQAKLTRAMNDARRGTTQQVEAFKKLGINVTNADGSLRSATDVMGEVFDALGQMENQTDADAIALQLLGRSAMEMNPLIKLGADGMRELTVAAEEGGAVMSETAVKTLDELGDEAGKANLAMKAIVGEGVAAIINSGPTAQETLLSLGYSAEYVAQVLGDLNEETAEVPAVNAQAQEAIATMGAGVDELIKQYEAAKQSALDSLNSQIGKWSEVEETAARSTADLKKALDSQIQWFTEYRTNLDALASRQIPGVDTSALVQSLSDGSTESAAILAGLVTATDEEIKEIVRKMEGADEAKNALSETMAEMETDFSNKMDEIVGDAAEMVKGLDKSDDAYTSGENTLQGYINGINDKSWELNARLITVANGAMATWRSAWEEQSPSKIMIKSGENAIAGNIVGIERMQDKLDATYASAALSAQDSFNVALSTAPSRAAAAQRAPSDTDWPSVAGQMMTSVAGAVTSMAGTQGGDLTIVFKLNDDEFARGFLPSFRRVSSATPIVAGDY
jgi:chromosome segregation ATPase